LFGYLSLFFHTLSLSFCVFLVFVVTHIVAYCKAEQKSSVV